MLFLNDFGSVFVFGTKIMDVWNINKLSFLIDFYYLQICLSKQNKLHPFYD